MTVKCGILSHSRLQSALQWYLLKMPQYKHCFVLSRKYEAAFDYSVLHCPFSVVVDYYLGIWCRDCLAELWIFSVLLLNDSKNVSQATKQAEIIRCKGIVFLLTRHVNILQNTRMWFKHSGISLIFVGARILFSLVKFLGHFFLCFAYMLQSLGKRPCN